jgi:hypothetical protein
MMTYMPKLLKIKTREALVAKLTAMLEPVTYYLTVEVSPVGRVYIFAETRNIEETNAVIASLGHITWGESGYDENNKPCIWSGSIQYMVTEEGA